MSELTKHSEAALEEIAELFKAFGDKTRLRIMQILHEGEKTVGKIVDLMGFSQANISKHLRVLYKAGLVSCRREGTVAWYGISDACVTRICSVVCAGHARIFDKKTRVMNGRKS